MSRSCGGLPSCELVGRGFQLLNYLLFVNFIAVEEVPTINKQIWFGHAASFWQKVDIRLGGLSPM